MSRGPDRKLCGLNKIFLIFIGVLISFFIIEFSLRIGGYFYDRYVSEKEITKSRTREDEGKIPIICVGDSNTYGAGAKPGYSYPEQLQWLIDKENMNYKVYNLGVPGMNSSTLLLELPNWIKMYSPRIVVLLIGANDIWNFQNSNYYLFQKGKRAYIYRFENFLFKFKTYKLLKLLMMNMNKLISGQKKNPINSAPIRKPNPKVAAELELAQKYFGQERDFNKVKEILEKMLILDPENSDAICLLGWVYLDSGETELAELNLKKAIEIDPYNREARRELFRLYRHLNKNGLASEELEVMLKIFPEDEELKKLKKFGIPYCRNEDLTFRQLKYNLIQVINLLKSKKVVLILQTYPMPYPSYITKIKDISREYNIPLIDNETTFRGLNYKDYSAADLHPNERGYSVIAKNVFAMIRKINDKTTP